MRVSPIKYLVTLVAATYVLITLQASFQALQGVVATLYELRPV